MTPPIVFVTVRYGSARIRYHVPSGLRISRDREMSDCNTSRASSMRGGPSSFEAMSESGRPRSDAIRLATARAAGVKRLMFRSASRKIVAVSVLLSRFCRSLWASARSSTFALSSVLTVASSSLSDCISSRPVSSSSLPLWSSSLALWSSSLADVSSSLYACVSSSECWRRRFVSRSSSRSVLAVGRALRAGRRSRPPSRRDPAPGSASNVTRNSPRRGPGSVIGVTAMVTNRVPPSILTLTPRRTASSAVFADSRRAAVKSWRRSSRAILTRRCDGSPAAGSRYSPARPAT